MRINIPQVGFETKIVEGKVTVISIESPEHYASVLNDIWNQSNGIPGEVIWSENEKQLRFDSEISCIFNVLDLDLNNLTKPILCSLSVISSLNLLQEHYFQ